MIEMKIEGLAELERALVGLPREMQKGPLRAAVSAAAKVVEDAAEVRAPYKTGTLRGAIYRARSRSGSRPGREEYNVGVRGGKKYQAENRKDSINRDAYYWRFVEFGTSKMQAKPFLRPAFDTTKRQQLDAMTGRLHTALVKAAEKLRRR